MLSWRKLFRALVGLSAFPVALQGIALVGVVALAANGWAVGSGAPAQELMTLRKTNLTTLVVWGLWWPGMVASALLLGRAWCTVCPMELLNRVGNWAARATGVRGIGLGRTVRAGWWIVLLYLVLQLLVAGASIHRVPHLTAILLIVLCTTALVSGWFFREPRSFCRGFCPAGALLSVYGRQAPAQLAVSDRSVCEACATKDCIRASHLRRFDKRSCPSQLRPFAREAGDGCVLCFQCVKVCPHDNLHFGITRERSAKRSLLRPSEAAFVMIALGFVAHEVIGEIKWLDAVFHWVPQRIHAWWPVLSFGWIEALWFLVGFPLVVWSLIAAGGSAAGHRSGVGTLLLAAATGAAPVVALGHLAKAAAKVASWGGYLPGALTDPKGLDTTRLLAAKAFAAPSSLLALPVLGWIMLGLIGFMGWTSWRRSSAMPRPLLAAARAGIAGAAVLFTGVLAAWSWSGR